MIPAPWWLVVLAWIGAATVIVLLFLVAMGIELAFIWALWGGIVVWRKWRGD